MRYKRIPIPYMMSLSELKIDPAAMGEDLDTAMSWFVDHVSFADEEACERIMRATVCLYHALEGPKNDKVTFGECFSTALTWERG